LLRLAPDEPAELIAQGTALILVHMRATITPPFLEDRIPDPRHIELASIETMAINVWPPDPAIVTSCACPHDASALRAAQLLSKSGRTDRVLSGGIDGWRDAGYRLEAGER